MRTTKGLRRVDVIYRRIDDDFLDPEAFRPDSLLGVPGLLEAYRAGNVALANAPGNGVADDKVDVRLRAGDDQVLPGRGPDLAERAHVPLLARHRPAARAGESGEAGRESGQRSRAATACWWARTPPPQQREEFAEKIAANPRNYIAQPTLGLSRVPTLVGDTSKAGTSICGPTSSTATTST